MNKLTQLLGADLMATDTFVRAITHRSAEGRNNERMEFLGDSVLGLIITTKLYELMPKASEGYLSRLRASLVNESTLADIASGLKLGDFLRLGPGELKSGGFRRKSILADGLEALIGCVYLEQGIDAARQFVLTIFTEHLEDLPTEEDLKDPKSRLQELLQSRGLGLPTYELLEVSGEAHRQTFRASCTITHFDIYTEGASSSRRKAEQEAASMAFQQVKERV